MPAHPELDPFDVPHLLAAAVENATQGLALAKAGLVPYLEWAQYFEYALAICEELQNRLGVPPEVE